MCEKMFETAREALAIANVTGKPKGITGSHLRGYQIVDVPTPAGKELPRVVIYPVEPDGAISSEQLTEIIACRFPTSESVKLAFLLGVWTAQHQQELDKSRLIDLLQQTAREVSAP